VKQKSYDAQGKRPVKGLQRRRLGNIASETVPPPKNSCDSWNRYYPDELSYPRIGKDSLQEKSHAQTTLSFIEISGWDITQESL